VMGDSKHVDLALKVVQNTSLHSVVILLLADARVLILVDRIY
jgi:hypothetical protein